MSNVLVAQDSVRFVLLFYLCISAHNFGQSTAFHCGVYLECQIMLCSPSNVIRRGLRGLEGVALV